MNFLKLFLRGIGLLPSVIQSVEAMFGAKPHAHGVSREGAEMGYELGKAHDAVTVGGAPGGLLGFRGF